MNDEDVQKLFAMIEASKTPIAIMFTDGERMLSGISAPMSLLPPDDRRRLFVDAVESLTGSLLTTPKK